MFVKSKMLQMFFTVSLMSNLLVYALNFSFLQNDFTLTYERTEVVNYSSEYFSQYRIKNFKFNRTQAMSNSTFTVKNDLREPLKFEVQAYKFVSNEYREFPLRFSYSFCQGMRQNDFGFSYVTRCGNLSKADCLYRKGCYFSCNFFVDGGKFPPHVPEGSYMMDLKWYIDQTEILFLQGYGTIKYKNFWQH